MAVEAKIGVAPHDHVVQFSADDADLIAAVGTYLADGIHGGEVAVAVMTERHAADLEAVLVQAGQGRIIRAGFRVVLAHGK